MKKQNHLLMNSKEYVAMKNKLNNIKNMINL